MKRLPHDPFLTDAWQQLLTDATLRQPQVGRILLLLVCLLFGLPLAWDGTHPAHDLTPTHAAHGR